MELSDTATRVEAAAQFLALGAVAVVGAGLSIDSRFPLTAGLNTMLWDALDSDLQTRQALAVSLKRPDGPSKKLIEDNWDDVLAAWRSVASSAESRRRFQGQFSALDSERASLPSPAHESLARLVHAGVVECVVSLNWDTALEQAYRRLYGVPLPEGVLYKPHGDAADLRSSWTLPHEAGRVPEEVATVVGRLAAGHARTLLIVGYSERDQTVLEQLIQPLDQTWRTIRVGPSATGPHDLVAGAEVVLPQLAEPYARREDLSSWHTLTYRGNRDITAALRGERLDPRDVDACPQLAEVELLIDSLRSEHSVVLNGPTGSGKSITAYQALRRLADDGFETLRLRDDARKRGMRAWLEDLRVYPRQKVLLLDDAQDMSPDTVRELTEHANGKCLVLVVGVDHVAGGVRTLRLGAAAAVARLGRWVREDRQRLFPMIRALDDNVGRHPNDLNFDRRIEVAERQGTPWRFFYTLTGGWRRIRLAALELRDVERADLALLAVAVKQIAGVDAGVERSELVELAERLSRDPVWLESALDQLTSRNLLLESEGRLRCIHLQSAYSVIRWMLHPTPWKTDVKQRPAVPPIASAVSADAPQPVEPTGESAAAGPPPPDVSPTETLSDRQAVRLVFEAVLDAPSTPLRGLAWLAGRGIIGDERDVLRWLGVFSSDRYKQLAVRALATSGTEDVAAAAQLLSDVITYSDGDVMAVVRTHDLRLREWYQSISPENAWALGDLVNSLHRPDGEYAAQVARYADPVRMSRLVLEGGWPHAASTGHALERLGNEGGAQARLDIQTHLRLDDYTAMLDTGNPEFWRVIGLLRDLLSVDVDFSFRLFEHAAPALARQFQADPLRNWLDMNHFVIRVGYGPHFLRGNRKHPLQKVSSTIRAFTKQLNHQAIADALSRPNEQWGEHNFYGFIDLLFETDPATFKKIAKLIDLKSYERALAAKPESPDHTALYVLLCLQEMRSDETHAILERLEPGMKQLDRLFALMAPDLAVQALRRGLPLDLRLDHQDWGVGADILERLYDYDPSVAGEVVYANKDSISEGLVATHWHDPWEDLGRWTKVCDLAAPGLLTELISALPAGAVAGWNRALKRPAKFLKSRKADIAPLVHRAAQCDGHVGTEAAQLLKKYPSITNQQ